MIIRLPAAFALITLTVLFASACQYNSAPHAAPIPARQADEPGEFYIMGQVARPGVYRLGGPGHQLTLKQAITAALTFDGTKCLEPPELQKIWKVTLIRREGDTDTTIRVNLAQLFDGTAPDRYLQPEDLILVGINFPTHFPTTTSP
jgi:hypothetical protein